MRALWKFLQGKRNREILGWLGGGAVVVIGGLWVLFVYLFPPGKSGGGGPATNVEASQGVAGGRDVTGNTITIAPGAAQQPAPDK